MDVSISVYDINRGHDIPAYISTIIDMLTCPISFEFVKDPWLAPDIQTYKNNISY